MKILDAKYVVGIVGMPRKLVESVLFPSGIFLIMLYNDIDIC